MVTGDEVRDKYNWDDLVRDLALTTTLTVREAIDLTYPLQKEEIIHPYDALTPLTRLSSKATSIRGEALVDLIRALNR